MVDERVPLPIERVGTLGGLGFVRSAEYDEFSVDETHCLRFCGARQEIQHSEGRRGGDGGVIDYRRHEMGFPSFFAGASVERRGAEKQMPDVGVSEGDGFQAGMLLSQGSLVQSCWRIVRQGSFTRRALRATD